jgi:DNA repair exonuclease SbcCD ATPase subunit
VFRYNPNGTVTERNYKSWSGGEKKRVSWAIDFGLSRLVAARATKRYDLLVLDEVFKHVDAAGGEAVVEMLQHLRQEKSSIFVIEHNPDFASHFENRLLVRKHGGRSQILMNVETENAKVEVQGNQNPSEPSAEAKPKRKKKGRSVPASAPT